jgi:hypothetical protein
MKWILIPISPHSNKIGLNIFIRNFFYLMLESVFDRIGKVLVEYEMSMKRLIAQQHLT